MRKKKLPATKEEFKSRQSHLVESLGKESDRGCVLVAAAVLEESLEQLLRIQMTEDPATRDAVSALFSAQGPFATFWSKTQTLYALGYLSAEVFRDLETIRQIRNAFAHQYAPAAFSGVEIQPLVAALITPTRMLDFISTPSRYDQLRHIAEEASKRETKAVAASPERARFALAIGWITASVDAAIEFYRSVRARGELRPPCVV